MTNREGFSLSSVPLSLDKSNIQFNNKFWKCVGIDGIDNANINTEISTPQSWGQATYTKTKTEPKNITITLKVTGDFEKAYAYASQYFIPNSKKYLRYAHAYINAHILDGFVYMPVVISNWTCDRFSQEKILKLNLISLFPFWVGDGLSSNFSLNKATLLNNITDVPVNFDIEQNKYDVPFFIVEAESLIHIDVRIINIEEISELKEDLLLHTKYNTININATFSIHSEHVGIMPKNFYIRNFFIESKDFRTAKLEYSLTETGTIYTATVNKITADSEDLLLYPKSEITLKIYSDPANIITLDNVANISYDQLFYTYPAEVFTDLQANSIDENIKPENIKRDVEIVGVKGTLDAQKPVYSGETTINPTTSEQRLQTSDKTLTSDITVKAVTANIDSNISPENIKRDVEIVGVKGTLDAQKPVYSGETTINPTTSEQRLQTSDKTLTSDITVKAVTANIDSNISPENIKRNINILGVVGMLEGSSGENIAMKTLFKGARAWDAFPLNRPKLTDSELADILADPTVTDGIIDFKYMAGNGGVINPSGRNCLSDITIFPNMSLAGVTNGGATEGMFLYNNKLKECYVDFSTLPESHKPYYFRYGFGSTSLSKIPDTFLNNLNKFSSINRCFEYSSLTDISQMTSDTVVNYNFLFKNCYKLTNINTVIKFPNSKYYSEGQSIGERGGMFEGCSGLLYANIKIAGAHAVDMFAKCSNLTEAHVTLYDNLPGYTENNYCKNISGLFYRCYKLSKVFINGGTYVTDVSYMFSSLPDGTVIDTETGWNTQNVRYWGNFLDDSSGIVSMPDLDISGMSTSGMIDFSKATSLTNFLDNPSAGVGYRWQFNSSISFSKNPLNRASILKVFGGLLATTATRTITISSTTNSYLSETDKAIATGKGWTIAIA